MLTKKSKKLMGLKYMNRNDGYVNQFGCVIILQCVHISKLHFVYCKYRQHLFVNYISYKARKKRNTGLVALKFY